MFITYSFSMNPTIYPLSLYLDYVNSMTNEMKSKMRDYGVKAVPTTIIDGKIKIVGIPGFPWICGDDLYKNLKREYPLETRENS